MGDLDLDDFITVNITCDQAGALAEIFTLIDRSGLWSVLSSHNQRKLLEFVQTMKLEIQNQKIGVDE
jgi:hypothetical protein